MPSHDTQSSPAEGLSRRSVIRGAATAGAAGLAATALGGALSPAASASTRAAGSTRAAASTRAAGSTRAAAAAAGTGHDLNAADAPIVVHVRNAKSGDIEVFSGTGQTRVRDADLAARIVRAIA